MHFLNFNFAKKVNENNKMKIKKPSIEDKI